MDFEMWIKRNGITQSEYARAAGLTLNTVWRRTSEDHRLGVPAEVAMLLGALEAVAGPSIVRRALERAAAELER